MKAIGKETTLSLSKRRAITLSLLSLLLLFISITNEIPQFHNHSPLTHCGDEADSHNHCHSDETSEAEISNLVESETCLFFQWNRLSQSSKLQLSPILFTEEFMLLPVVIPVTTIVREQTSSYHLRAPPIA